ncbi:aminoglycoside adenylyltransferase family protein [Streptomyces sp. NPDC059009]|uniref:aminoglycoside adenylyltransferase family protein n=1 Tax=Streptomyces sp. NPDC059009 TaxID=3346694 RepID=UPI0036C9A50A
MDQVREIVALVDRVLGPTALGTYLHGSAVLGAGLRPASDIDVLTVTRRPLTDQERKALLDGLLPLSGPGTQDGRRPVELIVVVQSDVRPWSYPPTADFLYGEWLRVQYEAGEVPRREPMPDLALLLTTVLSGDHALSGPPPARVLDPVPHEDVVRAAVAGVPDLLGDVDDDTRNVVLTLARIWTTLATGEIRTKDAAADWTLAHLPPEHRPVLEYARELYLNCRYPEESWTPELRQRVRPHVDAVLVEINQWAARPPRPAPW